MTEGIVTLANDVVYDQLVALLNSIEVNVGKSFPVLVIPYDNRLEKVKKELTQRKQVQLLDDPAILKKWEQFAAEIWQCNPSVQESWQSKGIEGVYRLGMHRRFCAYDEQSPLDKFIYCDGDVLVMQSLDKVFKQLDSHDFVTYDFQYKDLSHVYLNTDNLVKIFPPERIDKDIFCAGFYGSKKGLFSDEKRKWLIEQLKSGEAEILYPNAPDQTILNYMVMRSQLSYYNFALNLPPEQKTGNSVTSPHFEQRDNLMYDKGKLLTYLHYIGVPGFVFTKICQGENLEIPYRDIFLHYRYLHEPEKRPEFQGKPKSYNPPPSLSDRILRKLKLKR
ncbi:MAG: Npun_R2821/Npun_R2822 family protein [Microcystaceae cyanobacterium]